MELGIMLSCMERDKPPSTTSPCCRYARRSKTERGEWSDFTRDYFLNREVLANVLLLVDSSVPPQDIDLESADWLGDSQVPYTLVFTKVRGWGGL